MVAYEIRVMCVDDNEYVAEALHRMFDAQDGFSWSGWSANADNLPDAVATSSPDVLLLDVDMPGKDAFEAARELADQFPGVKIIMFSGLVRRDLIDRAFEAGAWGYACKSDGELALLDAVRRSMDGEFVLTPTAREAELS